MSNLFAGLSSLRPKAEEDKGPKPPSEQAKRLQDYLAQQYGAGPAADAKPKKKKKKVKKDQYNGAAVRIVDNDVTGFASDQRRQENEDDDEDQPVVANAEEAELLRRQAEQERELLSRGNLSAWETVEDPLVERRKRPSSPGEDAEASPPRRRVRHDSPDASPPRRTLRHDSPDASPPRRRPRHDGPGSTNGDASPPRRRQRHDSPAEKDASPPRRRARYDSPEPSDASPPRRGRARHDSPEAQGDDLSPPRRLGRHDSPGEDADASPPRRGRGKSPESDASPPRRRQIGSDSDVSPPRRPTSAAGATASGKQFMSDGTMAGMVSGREIQEEMARKREAEARRFAELDAEVTGRHAETVYRDKSGQKLTREEFVEARAAERRARKSQYDEESQLAWGGGLKQKAERAEAERRMREELAKPFARGHDADYDAEQRKRTRWGDPMAHLVKKKAPELAVPPSLVANQEAMKKLGFVIPLEVPQHSWPRRGVGAPPNRYNINPGRHWDGVDRSNGFERDMFKRQTELRRREQEAHMWAQGDM